MRGGVTAFRINRTGILIGFLLLFVALGGAPAVARTASSIIIDAESGRVLYESNADARTYPASLTKMMTLYLLFEALENGRLEPNQRLAVSRRAAGQPATNLALQPGDPITVDQAIRALIIRSANDVAVVVAEALAGTESKFAQMMTAKARQLGMKSTTFMNASGLPDAAQKTTARDLARLAQALIRDFPQYYPYFSTKTFSYRGRNYATHNRILGRYAGADGLKTGYINASGYNLATSAVRDGRRLIGIVLGGSTASKRDQQMVALLDRGFSALGRLPRTEVAANVGGTPRIAVIPAPKPLLMAAADAPDLPLPPVPPGDGPPGVAPDPVLVAEIPAERAVVETAMELVAEAAEPPPAEAPPAAAVASEQVAAGEPDPPAVPSGATALAIPVKPEVPEPAEPDRNRSAVVTVGFRPPEKPPLAETLPTPMDASATASGMLGQLTLGPWGVQVGAFSKFDPAHRAATAASQKSPTLRSAFINIEEVVRDTGRIFRARIIGLTEDEAQTACRELKAKKIPCVIVRPEMTLAMSSPP